mgnify:CR=1 FL=1
MKHNAKFEQPSDYKIILKDSNIEDTYYGLDSFDGKYLKILQHKFGCVKSYHTIPARVKMELAPYNWNGKKQKFILEDKKRVVVQVNQLENMVVSYKAAASIDEFLMLD